MKKPIILFTVLLLSLTLFSCGDCTEHTDTNGDGICDECEKNIDVPSEECTEHTDTNGDKTCDKCGEALTLQEEIPLIEGGAANFTFVFGQGTAYEIRMAVNELKTTLATIGITVNSVEDRADTLTDCEVLIGNVTSRGDKYIYDNYSLGKDGYAIMGIDGKVLLAGGSTNSLLFAIELFATDILGFTDGVTEEIDSAIFKEDIIEPVTDYNITSLSVRGNDMRGYTIAVDRSDADFNAAALTLQDVIYSNTGYYLPIVKLSEAQKSIVIEHTYAGEKGFSITTADADCLHIKCNYSNKFISTLSEFLAYEIQLKDGDINFGEDYLYEKDVSIVTYEEFGAVGNGYTDDSAAIKKAHAFANECGQTVVARSGATYLIRDLTSAISIKTNVIWTKAFFTVDMRGMTEDSARNCNLFSIDSNYKKTTLSGNAILNLFPEGKIDKDNFNSSTFNWPYDYPAIVVPINNNNNNYIRNGVGTGSAQMELFYVDENGNVSEDTPFLFDYEEITSVLIIRCDDNPITIKGGTFNTIAPNIPITGAGTYMGRGIRVLRSNVTLDGVIHYVKEVADDGQKYPASSGFIFIEDANNVTLKSCVFTGRKKYYDGTYDFQCYRSNGILLENCTQSNFYVDEEKTVPSMHGDVYWGVMGSSYCKNITFDTCMLSRFDAHAGLYNGKIINSTINAVEIIGGGTMLIENTHFVLSKGHLIDLRTDYGSTWRGDIIIRNCNVTSYSPKSSSILRATWMNRSFGYTTYMPNLVIDGLKYDNVEGPIRIINLTTKYYGVEYRDDNIHKDKLLSGAENKNPYQPLSSVTVLNNGEGYEFILYDIPIFENVILEGVNKVSAE